jgi:hypothetical protein
VKEHERVLLTEPVPMDSRYLEVTYREGRVVAAYLHLPRPAGVKSARTEPLGKGLLVDFSGDGTAIGLEIAAPGAVTPEEINAVLAKVGVSALGPEELAPLAA